MHLLQVKLDVAFVAGVQFLKVLGIEIVVVAAAVALLVAQREHDNDAAIDAVPALRI